MTRFTVKIVVEESYGGTGIKPNYLEIDHAYQEVTIEEDKPAEKIAFNIAASLLSKSSLKHVHILGSMAEKRRMRRQKREAAAISIKSLS